MITYPDTGTHHWSLARVDVPFDWTRMPSGNDIAMHLLLVDPPHRTFAKVGAAVYHGGDDIIVAQTSRCARALPSVPVPTAALIPSLSGAAHRRTALQVPRVRSLSGSRLSLGLPKRFQSFLRLYAHPDPLLHPAPLRCAMDICSHIYPSLDPVLTPPLRVRPVSSCLHPHPDRHPRSSSSYGAPLLVPSPPQPPRRPAESAHPTPALRSRWSSSILSSLHSTHGRARAPKTFSFGRYPPPHAPHHETQAQVICHPSCTAPHGQRHRPAYDVPRRVE
ncbi:hypothetical protein B0H14DRAFT_1290771 [Mycena olivaceomarginata]|nr:hypothetical protein B0H14DRAFT_1290771 [Mycena olivaceomarginata]